MHNRYTEYGRGRKAETFLLHNIETECGAHPPHRGIGIGEFFSLEVKLIGNEAEYPPRQGAQINP